MSWGWHADRKRLLMLLLGLTVGVEFLENGMFVFAASHIVGGIDAAPREFAQVQAAYAIGSMTMIVLQQWLSRHFGYRRYLSAALALFMLGGLACAGAQDLPQLTLARLLQGFGGGALFTSCRVLVPMLFGPRDRPRALKDFMMVAFALSAAGPLLSAALVEHWGWRWVFLASLPLAALAMAGAWWLMPDNAGRGGEPVRWAAGPLLLFAAAVTLVQMGLAQARFEAFAHPARLAITALCGLGLLAWFFAHQLRHDEPLVRLRELGHPVYLAGLGLYFVHYCLAGASGYVFPIYAERGLGIPLITAGWLNTFSALVTLAAAWAYIKRGARLPRKKPLMAAGALALAVAAWMLSSMPPEAPAGALLFALAAKGVFGALLVLPVAGLTFRDLGDERFAHGYQSKNLMRQVAGTFASALAAITLQDRQFANASQIASHIDTSSPQASNWLDGLQASLTAQGLSSGEAHHAAMASLSRLVDQQALLMSCGDLYRLLAALALGAAVVILVQRRLK
ncbi:MFS transporter [Variovorax sp. OV329]|uniref:MFS transporter n=1 Tax=Variovorax sp. OV329 TaxID=1882825 RepID=UPI0008EDA877|nr:MFS transporter [Variovorax sp. OV329]SFM45491.1 Major Facilitator Superfamily protein [Variovorax sp. OV329]